MKATITKIGNSKGIRIPKPILEQCDLKGEVDLEVRNHELIIRSPYSPRKNWEQSFREMAKRSDDILLDSVAETPAKWDEEEWEWK